MRLRLLLLGLIALIGVGVAQAATSVVFDVSAPDPAFEYGGSTCSGTGTVTPGTITAAENGSTVCVATLVIPQTTGPINGTVTEELSGLSGSLATTCNVSGSGTIQTETTIVSGAMSGAPVKTGRTEEIEDCAGHMAFSDGSSIDLTAHLDNINVNGESAGGGASGTITSGTGKFAGQVGSFTVPISAHARRLAAARADAQPWKAKLRTGAALAAVAYPGVMTTAATDVGLRVVSAPKTSCTATAASGGKTIKLGTKTTGTFGDALIVPKLTKVLKKGAWAVSVLCGSASAKKTITVS